MSDPHGFTIDWDGTPILPSFVTRPAEPGSVTWKQPTVPHAEQVLGVMVAVVRKEIHSYEAPAFLASSLRWEHQNRVKPLQAIPRDIDPIDLTRAWLEVSIHETVPGVSDAMTQWIDDPDDLDAGARSLVEPHTKVLSEKDERRLALCASHLVGKSSATLKGCLDAFDTPYYEKRMDPKGNQGTEFMVEWIRMGIALGYGPCFEQLRKWVDSRLYKRGVLSFYVQYAPWLVNQGMSPKTLSTPGTESRTFASVVYAFHKGHWSDSDILNWWHGRDTQAVPHYELWKITPKGPECNSDFALSWIQVSRILEDDDYRRNQSYENPERKAIARFLRRLDSWVTPEIFQSAWTIWHSRERQRFEGLITKAENIMHEGDVVTLPLILQLREDARIKGNKDVYAQMDGIFRVMLARMAEWELKNRAASGLADASPPVEVTPAKEPPNMASKVMETIRQDAVDIALRSSVQRVRGIMRDRLATWWVRRHNPQRNGETEDNYRLRLSDERVRAEGFLKTETGESALAMAMGIVWSQASGDIPDANLRAFGDTVARELRISAGTDILDGFLEQVLTPILSSVKDLAPTQATTPLALETPKVSVSFSYDVEQDTAGTVQERPHPRRGEEG